MICILSKIALEEDSCPFTSQFIFVIIVKSHFYCLCENSTAYRIDKKLKVIEIQESHGTERYALNNTSPLEKYSVLICSFQVSLETQILPRIVTARMSSRATWSFETEMELAQIPSGCALGFLKLRLT